MCIRDRLYGDRRGDELPERLRDPETRRQTLADAKRRLAERKRKPVDDDTALPEPEKLELTVARVRHLVGDDRVGTPELRDTHRPDSFLMRAFAPRDVYKRQL